MRGHSKTELPSNLKKKNSLQGGRGTKAMLGRRLEVSDFKIEQSISKTNREVKARDINENIT